MWLLCVTFFVWVLSLPLAFAEPLPEIYIDATVSEDLSLIRGTLTIDRATRRPVDPLQRLPMPTDDRTLLRTFPGRAEQGKVVFKATGPTSWSFYALLPRRFGDIGTLQKRAMTANGGWYPTFTNDDGLLIANWHVTVHLPPGAVGAIGTESGEGSLRWHGSGERASLVVIPSGHLTPIDEGGLQVTVLTRRKPRKRLLKELRTHLTLARPEGHSLRGVIAEVPLRRRLARAGVGQSYVSDRAWRVTPMFHRYHRISTIRNLVAGLLRVPDPFHRELAAAAISMRHQASLRNSQASGLLRKFSWNPLVHSILYDRTLPFWTDILNPVHPAYTLHDDLVEVLDPHTPGQVVLTQILDTHGPGAAWSIGDAILEGSTLSEAAIEADFPPDQLEAWRAPYPNQDYRLQVDRESRTVRVERLAPEDAQAEVVMIEIDGERRGWQTSQGADTFQVTLPTSPKRVALDPQGHVRQRSRLWDTWPPKLTTTVAGWLSTVNFTDGYFVGFGGAWFRGRYDTRNLFSVAMYANQLDSPGFQLGYVHKRGPLQDGLRRPHRLSFSIHPAFVNTLDSTDVSLFRGERLFTIGAGFNYSWDTRVNYMFPLRGRSLSIGADAGIAPQTGTYWANTRASASGVLSFHPRTAVTGRISGALARGEVDERLLRLGGPNLMASLPFGEPTGTRRAIGQLEFRWAPIRNASVPLGLVWFNELQLSGGVEAGLLQTTDGLQTALGVRAGAGVVIDILGASPTLMGVTVGVPLETPFTTLGETKKPQVFLRFGQSL